jgi:hypothetical protein
MKGLTTRDIAGDYWAPTILSTCYFTHDPMVEKGVNTSSARISSELAGGKCLSVLFLLVTHTP